MLKIVIFFHSFLHYIMLIITLVLFYPCFPVLFSHSNKMMFPCFVAGGGGVVQVDAFHGGSLP